MEYKKRFKVAFFTVVAGCLMVIYRTLNLPVYFGIEPFS
ncbi:MAG: hypothetical protein ACI8UC_001343, partial [Psychromonas sp.]